MPFQNYINSFTSPLVFPTYLKERRRGKDKRKERRERKQSVQIVVENKQGSKGKEWR